jgi:hypothetical protein
LTPENHEILESFGGRINCIANETKTGRNLRDMPMAPGQCASERHDASPVFLSFSLLITILMTYLHIQKERKEERAQGGKSIYYTLIGNAFYAHLF